MNLQLLEGGSWAAVTEGVTVDLKIMSIDTGAGRVSFPNGENDCLVSSGAVYSAVLYDTAAVSFLFLLHGYTFLKIITSRGSINS